MTSLGGRAGTQRSSTTYECSKLRKQSQRCKSFNPGKFEIIISTCKQDFTVCIAFQIRKDLIYNQVSLLALTVFRYLFYTEVLIKENNTLQVQNASPGCETTHENN